MKRSFFISAGLLAVIFTQAQTYETAKNMAILQQFQKAREEVDKGMTNAKYASKPEAYILKACIYAGLAVDPKMKGSSEVPNLLNEAHAAYSKYKEMDPSQAMATDQVYQSGPINLYSGYYIAGYEDYNTKKWESGYDKLKKAVEYSDLLIEKKLITVPIDTNVLILAGITAENSNHKDEAAKFYGRLADKKIGGSDFESIYRFLLVHSFDKKDFPSFEKYKAIGAELYPKSEYFTFDKIDFAVGLEADFPGKLKSVEEILAADPNSFKANEILGEIIYDTLNPKEENIPLPSNADELEKKMDAAFRKAAIAKPGYENPWLYIGDHYINKAAKLGIERDNFAKDLKTRSKPGTSPAKDDIAKRDTLDKKYGDALELAREPYENAAALIAKKTTLTNKEKQQYKKAASYLADIFAYKKVQAKGKPADQTKYAAEEKKWNDLWETIK